MGALHNGHLALVAKARRAASITVASIFVNPEQFAPGEDLETYPRREAGDLERLEEAGCDIAYLPQASEIYPDGNVTRVQVPGLSDVLDGVYRPHFFYGVTTVVARLFLHVRPDVAVFGEKDFQQLQIIRRMVRDLGFPIDIIAAPTERAADGLALSSRNAYLSAEDRRRAPALHQALVGIQDSMNTGQTIENAKGQARAMLEEAGFSGIDYIAVVDPETLRPLGEDRSDWPPVARALGAAWLGDTRLIDNVELRL